LAIRKKAQVSPQNRPENRGAWHMRHETQAINKLDPLARGNETKRSSAEVAGYVLSTLTVAILLADAGVTLFIPTKLEAERHEGGSAACAIRIMPSAIRLDIKYPMMAVVLPVSFRFRCNRPVVTSTIG
jgi:hypothetical protein